jgi:hypothetical protein
MNKLTVDVYGALIEVVEEDDEDEENEEIHGCRDTAIPGQGRTKSKERDRMDSFLGEGIKLEVPVVVAHYLVIVSAIPSNEL